MFPECNFTDLTAKDLGAPKYLLMNGLVGKLPGKCCHCGCTEITFVNTFHLFSFIIIIYSITSQQTVNLQKGEDPR